MLFTRNIANLAINNARLFQKIPLQCFASAKVKFSEKLNEIRSKNPSLNIPSESAMKALINNEGMTKFIQRVYATSGLSLFTAFATSYAALNTGFFLAHPSLCMWGGFGLAIAGAMGTSMSTPNFVQENVKNLPQLRTENSPLRLAAYGATFLGLGLSASPLFYYVSHINPAIVPTSLALTTLVFGSASAYAYLKPKDSLLGWGSYLTTGLLGLVGIQCLSLLSVAVMGPNMFSFMASRLDTYAGLAIFTGYVAYDTHLAMSMYESGYADHLLCGLNLALDFWGIFMRVMQILSIFSSSD